MLPEVANAVLLVLGLLTAGACVSATRAGWPHGVYVSKPLPMLCALALAVQPSVSTAPGYRWLVLGGLALSLVGDIFLMLPRDRFLPGLASFLGGHLLYVAAFGGDGGGVTPWLAALFAGAAVAGYAVLYPGLGRLWLPVALYVAAIGAMGWQACERWLAVGQLGSLLALAGALLFMASDLALGFDRFRRPLGRWQAFAVLGTYFPAQLLIALSVGTGEGVLDWVIR